jgi:hypothetical protein
MMKFKLGKFRIFFLIVGLIILGHLDALGVDWHHYGTIDGKGQFFYDKDSIAFSPEGVISVWSRVIREDNLQKAFEEKKEATQKFIEGKVSGKKTLSKEQSEILYQEWLKEFLRDLVIPEKRMLIELKCGENKFRLTSGIEYNEKGDAQKGFSATNLEWLPIVPEAPTEALYRLLCQ